jgi:hypothetical protein
MGFTWLQLTWAGLQLAGLAAVAAVQYARDPDVFALLWCDPTGVQMLWIACAAALGGTGVYLGGCVLLNRWADRGGRRRLPRYRGLMVGLAAFVFVAFFLPATNLLTVGPAAVHVQRQMRGP